MYTRHRKRAYRRNELNAANIAKRQGCLIEVEQLVDQAEAIIIRYVVMKKKRLTIFGGTAAETLPINTSSYQRKLCTESTDTFQTRTMDCCLGR